MRKDAHQKESANQPPRREYGWIKEALTTDVFQGSMRWTSARSISRDGSSPNIEKVKAGFVSDQAIGPPTF
jgi:hypothetical protein